MQTSLLLVLACSMTLTSPPQVQLDRNESIFAGVVTSYVGPLSAKDIDGEIWGLRVHVQRTVYAPKRIRDVEVFSYALASDCRTQGKSREFLERRYPIGTTVIAYAWPARLLPTERGVTRLEAGWSLGGITQSPLGVNEIVRREADEATRYPDTIAEDFEYQKDLARLARASRQQRVGILKRMMHWRSGPYNVLVITQIGSSDIANQLIEKWRERYPASARAFKAWANFPNANP